MEDKGITLEQALKNIEIVIVDHFRGLRADHIALEQSLQVIKNALDTYKKAEEDKNKAYAIDNQLRITPEVGC